MCCVEKTSDPDCQLGSADTRLRCCSQASPSHGTGRAGEGGSRGSHGCVGSWLLAGWEERAAASVWKTSLVSPLTATKGGKKAAASKDLSDMDYLKSKVVKDSSSSSSTEEETDSEEEEGEESENEEDSGIAETISTHTGKKGKPKAQQTQQETPVEKKKKGSTLEVRLN